MSDFETFDVTIARRELERARGEVETFRRERDNAIGELAEVKAAVKWTMGKTKMADILYGSANEIPASAEGFLPGLEPARPSDDAARLDWVNKHGRVHLSQTGFCIICPVPATVNDATLPTIYNFRHILDICRTLNP